MSNTKFLKPQVDVYEKKCIEAGLKKSLWTFFKKHGFDTLEALYESRESFITMYTSVYFNTETENPNANSFWRHARSGLSQKFSANVDGIFKDPNAKINPPNGCYEVRIKIIDLHRQLDERRQLNNGSCFAKLGVKPEQIVKLIQKDGKEYRNLFFESNEGQENLGPGFSF